jgi:hypothetical protein
LYETEERAAEVRKISAAAVDDCRDAFNHSASRADDFQGLLDAAAPGDNIFHDQKAVAGFDLKPSAQDQAVFLLLRKNMRKPEGARHFVSDDQSSERGRDDALRAQSAYFFRKLRADFRRDPGVLQVRKFLDECGFEVVRGRGIPHGTSSELSHISKLDLVRELKDIDGDDVDGIVQFGANIAMAAVAGEAERWLEKPVIAVNTALYWHALRANGLTDVVEGFGSLLERH